MAHPTPEQCTGRVRDVFAQLGIGVAKISIRRDDLGAGLASVDVTVSKSPNVHAHQKAIERAVAIALRQPVRVGYYEGADYDLGEDEAMFELDAFFLDFAKPWIAHNGHRCPIDDSTFIECQTRRGDILPAGRAGSFQWQQLGHSDDVVAYRETRARLPWEA